MDIGQKVRAARQGAKLTQEQAAEALGVSRQTISNWENNKTYPDIVSVIKMSDLYSISLDTLLKGDPKMIEHLDESTNTVKSQRRFSKLILISVYMGVWALLMILFWCFTPADAGIGYSLLTFYLLLPVVTVVLSFLIGKDESWGRFRWGMIAFFAVMYLLMDYGTFSLANNLTFGKVNVPDFETLIPGAVCSAVGMAAGLIANLMQYKKKAQQ